MRYAPDELERCPTHPNAAVRHTFDADVYAYSDGRTSSPIRTRTVRYECAECCRELRLACDLADEDFWRSTND